MMKFWLVFALSSVLILKIECATPVSASSPEDNSRQAEKNASDMIKNDKIRETFVKCLLDKGPCSQDAANVKKLLPEAVRRGCDRCSEMHKKMIEKMMLYLNEKQPEILKQVSAKFDPKGEFMKNFLSKLQRKATSESAEGGQRNGQNKSGNQPAQTQQPKLIKN